MEVKRELFFLLGIIQERVWVSILVLMEVKREL